MIPIDLNSPEILKLGKTPLSRAERYIEKLEEGGWGVKKNFWYCPSCFKIVKLLNNI
jgi:hypothetical protein